LPWVRVWQPSPAHSAATSALWSAVMPLVAEWQPVVAAQVAPPSAWLVRGSAAAAGLAGAFAPGVAAAASRGASAA
jgi:hypothetical protein